MAMPIRNAIEYTVTNLPVNGTVSTTAYNGLNNAATSFHQRGKTVVSAHGGIEKGFLKPILGYKVGGTDHVQRVGAFRSVCLKFSIPSAYNRFSMELRYWTPAVLLGSISQLVAGEIQATANFLSGRGTRYQIVPAGVTGGNENFQLINGVLPFTANVGTMTTAYVELTFGVIALDGSSSFDKEIRFLSSPAATYAGWRSVNLSLYRDDQC